MSKQINLLNCHTNDMAAISSSKHLVSPQKWPRALDLTGMVNGNFINTLIQDTTRSESIKRVTTPAMCAILRKAGPRDHRANLGFLNQIQCCTILLSTCSNVNACRANQYNDKRAFATCPLLQPTAPYTLASSSATSLWAAWAATYGQSSSSGTPGELGSRQQGSASGTPGEPGYGNGRLLDST